MPANAKKTEIASAANGPLGQYTKPEPMAPAPDSKPVKTTKAAPPASEGKNFIFNKEAFLNEVGTKHPMAYSFLGPGRDGVWRQTLSGLKDAENAGVIKYDEKTGNLHVKDMNHPKVQEIFNDMKSNNIDKDKFISDKKDDKPEVKAPEVKEKNLKKPEEAPTPVKTHESGGSSKVNSEQISAYPIGGIKSDNVVVVNKQQKPLFTMNTNESIMMDAQSKTAHVIPNQRDTAVGPQKPDTQSA